jgi:hypothetical protein
MIATGDNFHKFGINKPPNFDPNASNLVCARLILFLFFIFIFLPGGPGEEPLEFTVEEPLKPFCSFFPLRRLSSSVVFQWGSLRQTLDLSKTTNEKLPWRRPSTIALGPNRGTEVSGNTPC